MKAQLNDKTWGQFIERLSGEDGCNFRKEKTEKKPEGEYVWACGDPATKDRFALTKKVLNLMKIDEDQGMSAIRRKGHACCDCEIVLNMSGDEEE